MSNLLSNRAAIAERVEAKRRRLVEWLREEVYTDYQTAAVVLGVTPATAYKTLGTMERDQIVERHAVGRSSVWALTTTGQLTYLQEGDDPLGLFDPRVSEVTVRHTLAIQRARLTAEAAGWTGWKSERRLRKEAAAAKEAGKISEWLRVPDGVATAPDGRVISIEVERTVKTPKRYQAIMADYLQMRKAGTVAEVQYLCETDKLAAGLSRLFQSIKSVTIRATEIPLKEEHYQAFKFFGPDQWPTPCVSADL